MDKFLDEDDKDPHQENPENEDKKAKRVFENIMTGSDHGHAAVDELIHAAGVESDMEEHLRGDAVTILSSYLEIDILIDHVLISDPESLLVVHAVQQLLQQALVVKVEVQLQHVENDDDVDLIEEREHD